MKKTTLLTFLLIGCIGYLDAQSKKQDFDNQNGDNWSYTTNIPFYSKNNDTDIWGPKGSNNRIESAFNGPTFLAGRDLDNPYSESVTGTASPEHILTFDPVYLGGAGADISFRVHYVGLDKGDYIYYQIAYDNGSDWTTYDYMEDIFRTTQTGDFNSRGWQEFKHTVLTGHDFVRMRLVIYQNGNAYLGFDDFELRMLALSTNDKLIDGFTYNPNPTKGALRIKANSILDNVEVYNILGKKLMSYNTSSTEVNLDLSNLSNGIYLLKAISGKASQTARIIKQ